METATTKIEFGVALKLFITGCEAIIDAYWKRMNFTHGPPPTLSLEPGLRYIRVVQTSAGSRSVYAFIDKTNGDILKGASWKAPAKHARGSIFDENPLKMMGPHGPAYLR